MNTTELLERYLHAVRFWLPKAQRNDIIAEMSEDIRSQIEAKEGRLGRKVNESELVAILKHLGDPMSVAHGYGPQRYLIGPVLFPIYALILKAFALFWVVPCLFVWLGFVLFSPTTAPTAQSITLPDCGWASNTRCSTRRWDSRWSKGWSTPRRGRAKTGTPGGCRQCAIR